MKLPIAVIAVASLLPLGCASLSARGIGPATTCAQDLIDHGYVSGRNAQRDGETVCVTYTPEEIALAKSLVDGDYQPSIGPALQDVQGLHQAQVDCAKAEYDNVGKAQGSRFGISTTCRIVVANGAAPAGSAHDVFAVASANPDLSSFIKAINDNGLADVLRQAGPITLLAPNNAAFAALDDVRLKKLAEDHDWAHNMLLKHVLVGALDLDKAQSVKTSRQNDLKAETMGGRLWYGYTKSRVGNEYLHIDRAKALSVNTAADNGVVDVIDTVLWQ